MKNITFCLSYRRTHVTTEFNALSRTEFIGAPTPLEYLPRFSDYLGRDIFIKRDDVTPMAMGAISCANWSFWRLMRCVKGRIRSSPQGRFSQPRSPDGGGGGKTGCTAWRCWKTIGTRAENYLTNGNRLLLDLFNVQVEMVDALTDPTAQLDELATRLEAQGFRPYVIPVGGSNALGALGYVESALEIAQQCEGAVSLVSGGCLWQCRYARGAGRRAGAPAARR